MEWLKHISRDSWWRI